MTAPPVTSMSQISQPATPTSHNDVTPDLPSTTKKISTGSGIVNAEQNIKTKDDKDAGHESQMANVNYQVSDSKSKICDSSGQLVESNAKENFKKSVKQTVEIPNTLPSAAIEETKISITDTNPAQLDNSKTEIKNPAKISESNSLNCNISPAAKRGDYIEQSIIESQSPVVNRDLTLTEV